jgi:biuret amidohydrolase
MNMPPSSETIRVPSRPHPFPLVLNQTALLVIDMQYDFCHPNGYSGSVLGADLSAFSAIIPHIQAVIEWARAHDVMVIYTSNAGYPVGSPGYMGRFLIRGEAGTELLADFTPLDSELVLDKSAQSAFVATALESVLRDRHITHLIFTGVTTECCVLGSYRHASDLGFYGLLLEDCCAAFSAIEHQAAIEVVLGENGAIGWVSSSEELLAIG